MAKHYSRRCLYEFEQFCRAQETRLALGVIGCHDDTHLDIPTVRLLRRTERLGTYFNGLDKQDQLIHVEVRGLEIAPIRRNWLASSLSGPASLEFHGVEAESSAVQRNGAERRP